MQTQKYQQLSSLGLWLLVCTSMMENHDFTSISAWFFFLSPERSLFNTCPFEVITKKLEKLKICMKICMHCLLFSAAATPN